jgi:preprotein translocase subunit SecE
VARNRQRAKDRQAARRAEREKQLGDGETPRAQEPGRDDEPAEGGARGALGGDHEREERLREADLEVGAPPEDLGRTDQSLAHSPLKEEEADALDDEDLEDYDFEDEEQPVDGEPPAQGPRGVRGGREAGEPTPHGRNRLIAFLVAVWAELQRVQWPNRKQLVQMTGVVLAFCLIAGGYLGLLDAIFSRLIQQIL